MIKFDVDNNIRPYTLVLSRIDHTHLGELFNVENIVSSINMNSANELSFRVYKYSDYESGVVEKLWDEITDFKYIYVPELKEYYTIEVEINDEDTIYKSITATSACESELSNFNIYGLEINTDIDIGREEYTTPTVFYRANDPSSSLLHRVIKELPQYSIGHVDSSLASIQRQFSVDDVDVYSFLNDTVAEEFGCLFKFDSVNRVISAYDLKNYCPECGYRGEWDEKCPKCGNKNFRYYGEDTTIYVDRENLAESVNFSTNTDSVKNCFKLVAGDDDMTYAIIDRNPNGSKYIYYFSEDQKREMPRDLVAKMEEYDVLVESYSDEYKKLMEDIYNDIDKLRYYEHSMMPTPETSETNAANEAKKLTVESLSPLGMLELSKSTSVQTVNTSIENWAKVLIKSGYFKVKVNDGATFEYGGENNSGHYGVWRGSFKITNYSDEEDVADTQKLVISVNTDYNNFIQQKVSKQISNDNEKEKGDLFDVLNMEVKMEQTGNEWYPNQDDYNKFKKALTLYSLERLTSFYSSLEGCINIMVREGLGQLDAEGYWQIYRAYVYKQEACENEISIRQNTVDAYNKSLEKNRNRQKEIQRILNFEKFLGEEMYKTFCLYKREQTYSNDNYISEGLENPEIFENADAFLEAAKEELYKSAEYQHQISTDLINLLAIKEFEPLKEKFDVGNFIRVGIDGKVYRLRLVKYEISFDDIQNISVEFSDVIKIKDGTSDLQSVLSKASNMAKSYGYVANQVKSVKDQNALIKDFVHNGLDATAMNIVNNADSQDIVISDTGLVARRKEEYTNDYEDYQLKLISNGLYTTSDKWRSVDTAIGKYVYTNPKTGKKETAFGVLAKSIVGNIIIGNELGIYSEDGGSTMSFDNYGLQLTTKPIKNPDGTTQYKRIFEVSKEDEEGNITSQMYIDTDGNIVLANNQMVQMGQTVNNINEQVANLDKIYVKSGTIENLLSKYATIDYLNAHTITAERIESAEGRIDNLETDNLKVNGTLQANEAKIKDLEATTIKVGEIEAYSGTFEHLTVAGIKIEEALKKIDEQIVLDVDKVYTDELNAAKGTIKELKIKYDTITNENGDVFALSDIAKNKDKIESLERDLDNAEKVLDKVITLSNVNKEKIDELNKELNDIAPVVDGARDKLLELADDRLTLNTLTTGHLESLTGNINTFLTKTMGAENLTAIHLTAENMIVDDAIITSAMIKDLDVAKLRAGTISTDKFNITSDDGRMTMNGSTQQFIDENGNVRLQIGKDAEGNFNFIVFGEDGKTAIYNENGITENAIADQLIVNDMIKDGSVDKSKLNFNIETDDDGNIITSIENIYTGDGKFGVEYAEFKESVSKLEDTVKNINPYFIEITSSNGNMFRRQNVSTKLICRVYQGNDDVTDTIESSRFHWVKLFDNGLTDDEWIERHSDSGNEVEITSQDVYMRATFDCYVDGITTE